MPGESRNINLKVSESYVGRAETIPVRVIRAKLPGPTVFLTGAVHGDELTGVGVIREIMMKEPKLKKGSLIMVPIVNIFGFENHSRYLPDRRDLNRCFPGNMESSMAGRLAHVIYKEVVKKSDYGIDLHSAATRRTNFPQIRADLSITGMKELAMAFGCEVIVDKKAHANSLRGVACKHKCPTILYEAGEVLKFEPGTVRLGVRGVLNILRFLGMLKGKGEEPAYQTISKKTIWMRSDQGGILHFHVKPGDVVKRGDLLATAEKIFSHESQSIKAQHDGIIIGMTTLPAVKPGEAVCHVAVPRMSVEEIRKKMEGLKTLHRQVQVQLGASFKRSQTGEEQK